MSLQEAINETRWLVWRQRGKRDKSFLAEGIIEADGTIAETSGEGKGGMDISYKGSWGYAPLIVSLANTNEALYLVNRSGNKTSADGAAAWLDRAIDLVGGMFEKVWLRGDRDFSLTKNFGRWSERVSFVFGYDAKKNLVRLADEWAKSRWQRLNRRTRYEVQTQTREARENVKEAMVQERAFVNIRLKSEDVAKFSYRPVVGRSAKVCRQFRNGLARRRSASHSPA